MKIQQSNNINYKAGLTRPIKTMSTRKSAFDIANDFVINHDIDACFNSNKEHAFCIDTVRKIMTKLFPKETNPPAIRCFNTNQLIYNADNFCINQPTTVFEDEPPFEARSIFFKEIRSLDELDYYTELAYLSGKTSSPHFLASIIHEWMHAVHLYILGQCKGINTKILLQAINTEQLSEKDKKIVEGILGNYCVNSKSQHMEIFAETFTQLICKSLDKNLELKNDPISLLKTYPKEFQNIIYKNFGI